MTRTLHTCHDCSEQHASIWALIMCCDPAAPGDTD